MTTPAESEIEQALSEQAIKHKRRPGSLRLASRLEWLYLERRRTKRPSELALSILVGTVVYNLYSLFGRALIADIPQLVARWHVVASAILLVIALSCAARINAWLRESLHVAGLMAISLGSIWVCDQSTAATAPTYAAAAMLIPFYAVVAGRMPNRYSVILLCTTVAGYPLLMHADSAAQAAIVHANFAMMCLLGLFIMVAGLQIEHGAQQSFVDRLTARQHTARLRAASHSLWRLSGNDPLTGIGNRRRFDADLPEACAQALAGNRGLGLLLIDIDDFKQYNDLYGHTVGDGCLSAVARAIADVAAEYRARAYRIGGEEFALLLSAANTAVTRAASERVRTAVADLHIQHAATRAADTVSASVGGAYLIPRTHSAAATLIARADQALYAAKSNGRNRCEFAQATTAKSA